MRETPQIRNVLLEPAARVVVLNSYVCKDVMRASGENRDSGFSFGVYMGYDFSPDLIEHKHGRDGNVHMSYRRWVGVCHAWHDMP